jgi:hypothetical protein
MSHLARNKQWTDFLTKEEFAQYVKEMDCRRWCLERMKDHDNKIASLKSKAVARRSEVNRVKEAAE